MINNYKIKSRVIKSVNGLDIHVLENKVKVKKKMLFYCYMVFLKSHSVTDI